MPAHRPAASDRVIAVRSTLPMPTASRRRSSTVPVDWHTVDYECAVVDGLIQELVRDGIPQVASSSLAPCDLDLPDLNDVSSRSPASLF